MKKIFLYLLLIILLLILSSCNDFRFTIKENIIKILGKENSELVVICDDRTLNVSDLIIKNAFILMLDKSIINNRSIVVADNMDSIFVSLKDDGSIMYNFHIDNCSIDKSQYLSGVYGDYLLCYKLDYESCNSFIGLINQRIDDIK